MSGLLLRLAGPLQSWGERSAFTPVRDSAPFPTRSALTGILAAAEGIGRNDGRLDAYDRLHFTVRVDRPGTRLVDDHTVGGGFPKAQTAATSGGSNKGAAVITRRHYLADAVFTIAVTGPDTDTRRIAHALQHPQRAPYLGRRSCVPDEPFLLRAHAADPVAELRHRVPLSREPARPRPAARRLRPHRHQRPGPHVRRPAQMSRSQLPDRPQPENACRSRTRASAAASDRMPTSGGYSALPFGD